MSSRVVFTSYGPVEVVETQSGKALPLFSSIVIETATAPPVTGVGNADGVASVNGVAIISIGVGNADGVASANAFSISSIGVGNADGMASADAVGITNRGTGHADGVASVSGSSSLVTTRGGAALLMA